MFGFIICVLISLCSIGWYFTEYFSIDLYDVVYVNRIDYNDNVVVLNKNLLYVQISRMYGEPEYMLLIEFLINYTAKF